MSTFGADLEFKLLGNKKKEVDPGASVNVLVSVTNNSDTDKDFRIQLTAKDGGWKLITDYSAISIEKKSKLNKVVGILIPNNFQAGDYSIELEAFENPGNVSIGKATVPLFVKSHFELQVEKQRSAQYLFAGDTLGVHFSVRNLSNQEVPVLITSINGQDSKQKVIHIAKDSIFYTSIPVLISKDIQNYTQQSVILSAKIENMPETEQSLYHSFDVFPSDDVKFDAYNRYPIRISGMGVTSNRYGRREYSTMYDVYGSGFFDETGRRKLDFHLRGPDRTGNPLFGLNDEYSMMYSSKHLELVGGDYNFSLSDLTESSRNGRGVKLQYSGKNWSVGSYYNIPRYYPLIKNVYTAYANYYFNPKNKLSVGFLAKTDTTQKSVQLLTVSGANTLLKWFTTDYEVSFGSNQNMLKKAYRGFVQFHLTNFSSFFSMMYADPEFPGFVTNSRRIYSGLFYNLNKISIGMNYDVNDMFLAVDTLFANAPFSNNISLSVGYRIHPMHSISFGIYSSSQKDRSATPLFNYSKYNGRMNMQSRFGPFSLSFQGELGKIQNFLGVNSGDLTNFYSSSLSMNYELTSKLFASGYVNYQGGKQYRVTGYDQFYYGGSLIAVLENKLSASLTYNSNYELKDYTTDRSLLSAQVHGEINRHNSISLGVNYNLVKNTLNTKELSAQLRYTYTLNLPVSKKKNIGSLKGRIINQGVETVQGVRLSLNGPMTITDKDGYFRFPAAKVGTFVLGTDESSYGLNAIPVVQGPYYVTIESGKVTNFEFAMTKSATVSGRLVIQEDERSGKKGFYPIKENIDKLIIEASNGKETFRILSNQDGTFRFEDLRPGDWNIKVYPNGIPQGYQLVTDQFKVTLIPDEDKKVDVIIQKKIRQIRFQSKIN